MKICKCKWCWNWFLANTSWCYCSDECRKKATSSKSAAKQKAARQRIKACIKCWKEYPTRRWQTKYCEECYKEVYRCPSCWWIKENIALNVCKSCAFVKKICPVCLAEFITKWVKLCCSEDCSIIYRKQKKLEYYYNDKELQEKQCSSCWKLFKNWWWQNHKFCEDCDKIKHICPECWWHKKYTAKRCHHCSTLSRTFVCSVCWKEWVWVKQTKFCDDCYPRCEYCWKKCDCIYEKCCSISCATKKKRADPVTSEKLKTHLEEMMSWKFSPWSNSSYNNKREQILIDAWFEVEREFRIDNNRWYKNIWKFCFYDLKIWKFLIEIDPTASHNSSFWYNNHAEPKPKKYHQEKSLLAEANWYQPIHIFDWDDRPFVKDWLIWLIWKRKRLYSKDIRIVDWKTANEFCDANHLQWRWPSTIWYWLYVNDELINLLWMLKQNWEWNLNRFCSKKWFYIAHWAEKLFKRFLQDYNPDHVISFSDITKHSWWLYNALWFELEEIQNPSYRWVEVRTWIPHRRRDCQKQNMHNLPWFDKNYKYKDHKDDEFWKQTEAQLMESHWYARVYDSWMRKHVRYKN